MSIYNYWAKAQGDGWHLLPYHCLDVAASAQALLAARPEWRDRLARLLEMDEIQLSCWLGYFTALHDLGKFADAFQGVVPEVRSALGKQTKPLPYDIRHDSLGWVLYQDRLFSQTDGKETAKIWMRCATGHHGQPPSRGKGSRRTRIAKYFLPEDLEAAEDWLEKVGTLFHPMLNAENEEKHGLASWWLAGIITIADWVGSNTDWFPYESAELSIADYFVRAQEQSRGAIEKAGLAKQTQVWRTFGSLFPAYTPSPLQSRVDKLRQDGPFFLAIEDLTGSGKTEAALTAAGDSFYFGLPTQATANGLWHRVSVLDQLAGSRSLIHSSRWFVPNAMTRASAWLSDSSRQAMLSTLGVGTIDQAELAVLYTRFQTLRLVALLDKTVIVDEVHAYDSYQCRVLKALIEFQAAIGASVILLSATLPLAQRQEYAKSWMMGRNQDHVPLSDTSFPLLTHITDSQISEIPVPSKSERQMAVSFVTEPPLELISRAIASDQCVCWVRNTVDEAIEAYEEVRRLTSSIDLFHARFAVGDRAVIEQRVLSRFGKESTPNQRRGQVLIATQVVEQSLDLDFDVMISDLAPIDLLIQRAGRQHRHDRGDRGTPTFWIHSPTWTSDPQETWVTDWSRGTAFVYPDHGRLWLGVQSLRNLKAIVLPDNAREVIESVYGADVELGIPSGLSELTERANNRAVHDAAIGALNTISTLGSYENDANALWDEEFAPTRLGEPSTEWVLCDNEGQPISGNSATSVLRLPRSRLRSSTKIESLKPWQSAMILTRDNEGWLAEGESGNGEHRTLKYDDRLGLRIE